jgi:tetratricopeptide (TPR) repeat protein
MVGREEARNRVLSALQEPGVVRIRGQAGIGKSRFLAAVLESIPEDVLILQAQVEEQGDPYQVFRDWIEGLAHVDAHTDEDARRTALETHLRQLPDPTGSLRRRIPFLGAMLYHLPYPGTLYEQVGPALRKDNLLEGLRLYLRALGRSTPLLLAVDNAQWLQPTSMEFLNQLMADLLSGGEKEAMRVSFVLTGRDHPGMLHRLHIPPGRLRLDLTLPPLSREDVRRLVHETLRRSLSPSQIDTLLRVTQGVPLYLEQWLLQESTGEQRLEELLSREEPLSESVWNTVMSRMDRLPASTQNALRIGSVVGTSFPADIVEHLTGRGALELLFPAEQAGLVERTPGPQIHYAYRHASVQEVIYRSMLETDRRELHAKVAGAFLALYPETHPGRDELLAHHYLKAENWERAFFHLRLLAEEQFQRGQLREALERTLQALDLLQTHACGTREDAFSLHLKCAQITDWLGDAEATEQHFLQAEQHAGDDPALLARVFRERAHTLQQQGASQKALEEILRAQSLLPKIPPPLPTFLKADILGTRCWIHTMRGEFRKAIQAGEEALRALDEEREQTGTPPQTDWMGRRAMLLNFLGTAHIWTHDLPTAEQLFQEAAELADIGGFQEILASVEGNLALLEQQRGDVERAIERTRRQLAYYDQLGAFREQARVSNNLGLLLLDLGRGVDEAEQLFTRSLHLSQTHRYPLIEAQSISCLGMFFQARGAYAQARSFFLKAEKRFRALHMEYYVLANRLNAALCSMEQGDTHEASRIFNALAREIHPSRMPGLRLELLVQSARLRILERSFLEMDSLFQEIQEILTLHPDPQRAYVMPYLRGLLAASQERWEDAEKAFLDALARTGNRGDARLRGDLLLELANVRIHLGKTDVQELLEEAERHFAAYPHLPKLQRIQQLRGERPHAS